MSSSRVRNEIGLITAVVLTFLAGPASALAGDVPTRLSRSPVSKPAIHHDTSPPLRSVKPAPVEGGTVEVPNPSLSFRPSRSPQTATDASEARASSPLMPATTANFEGIAEGGAVPPDPSGAAGPDQYMEAVNEELDVYSKDGTPLLEEPIPNNTLWQGFGGTCETEKGYDGTVVFDTLAERWVIQHQVAGTPDLICVAVSSSSDATGTWHRYSFEFEGADYSKMGVWPDAYYLSTNAGGSPQVEVCAFDRAAMLTGGSASAQCFRTDGGSLEPASLDGSTSPPSGEPEWFVALSGSKALAYWKLHIHWETPANSTLTGPTNLPVKALQRHRKNLDSAGRHGKQDRGVITAYVPPRISKLRRPPVDGGNTCRRNRQLGRHALV